MPLKKKHCLLHNMPGHDITECKAFESMTVGEREEWIFKERLYYCCFSPNHIGSACKESIKCSICRSEQHPDLLHLSREDKKSTQRKRTALTFKNSRKVRKREPQMHLNMQRQSRWSLMQQDRTGRHLQRRPPRQRTLSLRNRR